ncbi:pesticin C-terminus-like muramidase [uncultured Shewanella sp.]|uniref:pesticin C-terminus-like muramidase n=1 Tax=uncultured Shewanella sp. TaxID=173975 RepID=UPI00261D289D|nr:pesticin C-terminus-like muramidase [uncultured Shewanella sp.]
MGCKCYFCNPTQRAKPAPNPPCQLTPKEKVLRQQKARLMEANERDKYNPEDEARFAAHVERILAKRKAAAEAEKVAAALSAASLTAASSEVVASEVEEKDIDINFNFISSLEGGSRLTGYVPDAENSKSGVTVAVGFDLGARNASDLMALGLPIELINKLNPYLGLQSVEAKEFLEKYPVTITQEEAEIINKATKANMVKNLVKKYDSDSNVKFVDIPPKWQTVIASAEFQYGSLKTKGKNYWGYVTSQNWQEAIAELRDYGDRYPTRRNDEADYVENN